jgi:hypothetical protein
MPLTPWRRTVDISANTSADTLVAGTAGHLSLSLDGSVLDADDARH